MILIDTDICIALLRGKREVLQERKAVRDIVAISFMSVAELYYGVFRSKNIEKNIQTLELFLLSVQVIHSDREIMQAFGRLKDKLYDTDKLIPDADLLIAATCLTHCDSLVTGNHKHFARFTELKTENWLRS